MKFDIYRSLEILERTPKTISVLLDGLSDEWIMTNEGGETWCVYDVVGHLIHGEKSDWITRMEIILSNREHKEFQPFDRFAQFRDSKGKSLKELLHEFEQLRSKNIEMLKSKMITQEDLTKTALHPALGEVSLSELLSTWVAHDLNHLAQISRVIAKQYKDEVGPWVKYLRILN